MIVTSPQSKRTNFWQTPMGYSIVSEVEFNGSESIYYLQLDAVLLFRNVR